MESNTFKININNLKEGGHKYSFSADSKDFDFSNDEVELVGDVHVDVNLYKVEHQFSLKTDLKGKFRFVCDRCLEDFIHDFTNSFDIIYKYDFKEKDERDIEDDNIKFISPNTKHIDLKEDVRDYILLSIPMKKAPEEDDGICSYCNKDINEMLQIKRQEEINPVWEKLIKSKTK
ncbi:MAG: DUF177 domain-containing protein [Ignavibacteria bacterium]